MQNLLEETIHMLDFYDKTPADVRFINDHQHSCSWEDFSKSADFIYDNGFGGAEINSFLSVVGKDWWLERHEYDGSEWWEFKTIPQQKPSGELIISEDMRWEQTFYN